MPRSKTTITLTELNPYFHMPIKEASKKLGISTTVLKRICRENNINRWPHRKIKSLDKQIKCKILRVQVPNYISNYDYALPQLVDLSYKRDCLQNELHLQPFSYSIGHQNGAFAFSLPSLSSNANTKICYNNATEMKTNLSLSPRRETVADVNIVNKKIQKIQNQGNNIESVLNNQKQSSYVYNLTVLSAPQLNIQGCLG